MTSEMIDEDTDNTPEQLEGLYKRWRNRRIGFAWHGTQQSEMNKLHEYSGEQDLIDTYALADQGLHTVDKWQGDLNE